MRAAGVNLESGLLKIVSKNICVMLLFFMLPGTAFAGPGDIIYSDDFDSGGGCSTLAPDWTTSSATSAGVNTDTSASGFCSLYTRHSAVTVTGTSLDLSTIIGAQLTAWVRKGADAFSEDPDNAEDLILEYQDAGGSWFQLQSFSGGSLADGAITNVNVTLPLAALHSSFRLRWRQTAGSGSDFDYWHVDDVVITELGTPPPPGLTANSCDAFENGLQNFTASNAVRVGTGSQTSNSPSNSLYLRHGTATATSVAVNTLALSSITVWIRRGADVFSENPDAGENLVVEAFDNTGTWVALETFPGAGTQGEVFTRTYTPSASLKHANFRIRFRLLTASGSDFDYWHVDDLCLVSDPPDIAVEKTSEVLSDPINGTTNPKAIPGAIVRYRVTITNSGAGSADSGSVVLSDTLGANSTFFAGNLDGLGSPFIFTDGTGVNTTGLSVSFGGLGSGSDGITFLDSSNSSITPTPDFDGSVAGFVIDMDGPMNGTAAGGTPVFLVEFDVRLE